MSTTTTDRPKSASNGSTASATRPKAQLNSIGHYDLDKNIGEGNFAKVRLAKHTITGQQVAIKIIDKNKLDKATSKKLFREVRIMRLLNNKNIVKLYEVIDTPDELFLVMEYVSGGEVFDYLVAHGRMKEKEARKHFRQIISAVGYCHGLHIIHRDLKAENLLLDENLNIKIADFGFSNQFNPGQKLNTWCGSPPYAAPELFQGKEYSGPEVDIWSLGVVLYVFVCGSLPFDGSNLAKLRARVIAGKFQVPFYMSPDCEKLIKRMLVIDPAKRVTIEQIMQDKWVTEGYENEPLTIQSSTPNITPDVHNATLDELEELGLEKSAVIKSLNEGLYDSLTATYYLIADRRINQPNLPAATKGMSRATTHKKPAVATNPELETFDEEDAEGRVIPRREVKSAVPGKIPEPEKSAQSATTATPPKVVTGGRRRATTTNTNTSTATTAPITNNEVSASPEPIHNGLPPPRSGRVPSASRDRTTQIASEIKDMSQTTQAGSSPPDPLTALPAISTAPNATSGGRHRAHTMATDTRQTEEQTATLEQFKAHLKDSNEPRTARFTFSVATTSTKEPESVFGIVTKCLDEASVIWRKEGLNAICKLNDIEFEIEVCKLPNLQVVGLRCKRLSGGAWEYKEVLSSLIAKMDL
ncbi:Map microtubule affinity-regulating kinase [Globomyces sp. JEL0801]|nr:Map microtubule affinity-regulating kinase [Globomyces sp. JEL0801]